MPQWWEVKIICTKAIIWWIQIRLHIASFIFIFFKIQSILILAYKIFISLIWIFIYFLRVLTVVYLNSDPDSDGERWQGPKVGGVFFSSPRQFCLYFSWLRQSSRGNYFQIPSSRDELPCVVSIQIRIFSKQ